MRSTFELIFAGFGNVGRRAAALVQEIDDRLPFACTPIALLTARHGKTFMAGDAGSFPPGMSTTDAIRWICEQRADVAADGRLVCIETTPLDIISGEPAISHVRAALNGRAHVVSANKGPAAFAFHELRELARAVDRSFLFEGAVMDGVPVLNFVRETLPGVRLDGFRGVINSTTNHILCALERGERFESALARMQADGIAEADPSLDVDGWDAAAKTAVLMNVLLDARVTPHDIAREGIRHVSAGQVRRAADAGRRLRLVASAHRAEGGGSGRVRVEEVAATDLLGTLEGQQNALLLRTDLLGDIGIVQRDGGLTQTAYAIVSDLCAIARARA